jgi:hypothetical protein
MSLVRRPYSYALCLIAAGLGGSCPLWAEDRPETKARDALARLASVYGIQIVAPDRPFEISTWDGTISGHAPEEYRVGGFARLLDEELSLYPKKLVDQTGLRRIILCEKLSFNGESWPSCAEHERREVFFNVAKGLDNKLYKRANIHHELFHLIDSRISPRLKSKTWIAINPREFRYRSGGADAQKDADTNPVSDRYPGFVNFYSTSDEAEDRAEVFATLVVRAAYIEQRTREDRVLREKVMWMKDTLRKWCPEVDDRFWERAQRVNRRRPSHPPVIPISD